MKVSTFYERMSAPSELSRNRSSCAGKLAVHVALLVGIGRLLKVSLTEYVSIGLKKWKIEATD